jgi:RNA polymerase sigma-70 factor (ECF subfamily)
MPGGSSTEARFQTLYRQHHDRVLRYCMRRVGRADAVDAAADVFVVAWRRIEQVPSGDRTLPWLYGVARRVLSNQWRSTRRFHRLFQRLGSMAREQPSEPERVIVQREEDEWVLDALNRLSRSDQEVLRLAAWEELSAAQIAEAVGCSPAAAQKRLYRAKGRLARHLGLKATDSPSSTTVLNGGGER